MKRYTHYLSRTHSDVWPHRIIIVDCVGVYVPSAGDGLYQREMLQSWHAACLLRADNSYTVIRTVSGRETRVWWSMLREQLADTSSLWVLSYRCGRVWPLLGLWEGLEDGSVSCKRDGVYTRSDVSAAMRSVRLASIDPLRAVSLSSVSRMLAAAAPVICTADPPSFARLHMSGVPASVTWTDARNYSAVRPAHSRDGPDTVTWLTEWLQHVSKALRQYRMGNLSLTVSGQALQGYRRTYYDGGLYCHTHTAGLAVEGAAYYGGRCEPYTVGREYATAYHLDISAAYGSVQAGSSVPGRLRRVMDHHGAPRLAGGVQPSECIATVAIETDEPAYPARRNGGVIYPIGRYTTTLCGPELADAVERCRVHRWYTVATYHLDFHLRAYARAMYSMREEAERAGDVDVSALAKALLVGLPGKLGQRHHGWQPAPECGCDIQCGEWWGSDPSGQPCRYRAISGRAERAYTGGWAADACPAVAAWVTAECRSRLLRLIRTAGWGQTLYIDTDSIIVTESGYQALVSAGECDMVGMGGLRLESGPCTVTVRGPKHYIQDGVLTCAGLPRGDCVDAGDGLHYWYSRRVSADLRDGRAPTAGRVLRRYVRSREYSGGVVQPDGRVTPHVLEEW